MNKINKQKAQLLNFFFYILFLYFFVITDCNVGNCYRMPGSNTGTNVNLTSHTGYLLQQVII